MVQINNPRGQREAEKKDYWADDLLLAGDDTGEWENILWMRDLGVLGDLSGSGVFWHEFDG